MQSLDPITQKNVESWLEGDCDQQIKAEITQQLQDNPSAIVDAFYTTLSFGTGGLRGIMGIGTNRMNIYTVRFATQGLANYLKKEGERKPASVVIGYDPRENSRLFAEEAARVLAGNGIDVHIFTELRPTPIVSFTCREKKCSAAIMITASHNPPAYNGYKVYWADGGQVVPPHDQGIIEEVKKIESNSQVEIGAIDDPHIHWIKKEMDAAYLETIDALQSHRESNQQNGHELHVVYSSLHGTGITLVPQALAMWGFTSVTLVESQAVPDGSFPTVSSPNPEDHEALKLGIEVLFEHKADLLLATDPDADRMGVAVRQGNAVEFLNGNEIACLCLDHLCQAHQKELGPQVAAVKTIVTSTLFEKIAHHNGISCFDVLTGFKYIASLMQQWEVDKQNFEFLFGAEESYGYLLGTHSHDKDAVIACALMAEVALQAKLQGKTLIDRLNALYEKYGVYSNQLISVTFPETKEGKAQMGEAMGRLRTNPPQAILGTAVVAIEDYSTQKRTDLLTKTTEPLTLPSSNVIKLFLEDKTTLTVRPSGTEPKVKLYGEVTSPSDSSLSNAREHCSTLCKDFLKTTENILLKE